MLSVCLEPHTRRKMLAMELMTRGVQDVMGLTSIIRYNQKRPFKPHSYFLVLTLRV